LQEVIVKCLNLSYLDLSDLNIKKKNFIAIT